MMRLQKDNGVDEDMDLFGLPFSLLWRLPIKSALITESL